MRIQRTPQVAFFTIVPNATARDHALSFTARGILAYLLSLPAGRSETVVSLSEKSVEGRKAVSAAMAELEKRGYLARKRVKGERGTITTEVVVFDVRDGASSQVAPNDTPVSVGGPVAGSSVDNPIEDLVENSPLPTPVVLAAVPAESAPEGRAGGEISRSENLLSEVSRSDRRLHLSARDMRKLAPLVETWFERGADKRLISLTLTAGLPDQIQHPAGLLRKRLEDKMPTAAPVAPVAPVQAVRHHCPVCERIKAPTAPAGLCEHCRALDLTPAPAPVVSGLPSWRDRFEAAGVPMAA
jgi:hypothetical protein